MRTQKKYTIFLIVISSTILLAVSPNLTLMVTSQPAHNDAPRHLLITELYYHARAGIPNEFITIYNPLQTTQDISGWYITTKPEEPYAEQPKIFFPDSFFILPYTAITLSYNASAYHLETGKLPDYEYGANSRHDIPQLQTFKSTYFSNTGAAIALKNPNNQTIDLVVYGNINPVYDQWIGPPINHSGVGVILKRNFQNNVPLDTNTAHDWEQSRRYGIGQTQYTTVTFSADAEITTFVSPDCSYEVIAGELRKATESIYLNMYVFTNSYLFEELQQALHRDVYLFIFVEGSPVGGLDSRMQYILTKLAHQGATVRLLKSDADQRIHSRYRFNHAKYLIIDNTTVIIESCNWARTGVPKDPTYGNREWGIVIKNQEIAGYYLDVFFNDSNPFFRDSMTLDTLPSSILDNSFLNEEVQTGLYTPQFQPTTVHGAFSITPVLSPDTSEYHILTALASAQESILIQQSTFAQEWSGAISPFVAQLITKAQEGVKVKVMLNYNPNYYSAIPNLVSIKQLFEDHDIHIKFLYTNWSIFANMHNKGMIIDNTSVLVSSINWNENSVRRNREVGVIITNTDIAKYYADVFYYDWALQPLDLNAEETVSFNNENPTDISIFRYRNELCLSTVIIGVCVLILIDWKRRH